MKTRLAAELAAKTIERSIRHVAYDVDGTLELFSMAADILQNREWPAHNEKGIDFEEVMAEWKDAIHRTNLIKGLLEEQTLARKRVAAFLRSEE